MAESNNPSHTNQLEPRNEADPTIPKRMTLRDQVESALATSSEKEVEEKRTASSRHSTSSDSDSSSEHSGRGLQHTRSARSRSLSRTVSEVRDGIENRRDLEIGTPDAEKTPTADAPRDPNLVTWDSPTDTGNPKQWSMKRKWAAVFCSMSNPCLENNVH